MHGFSAVLKAFFTILSSKEWNVMMQSRPLSFKRSIMPCMLSSRTSSSLLSSILIAWNVLLDGCPPVSRTLAGIEALIMSLSSNVVSIFLVALAATMCFAMFFANLSSP